MISKNCSKCNICQPTGNFYVVNGRDLSNPIEQQECFHYTNMQPLWATTEIAKQNGCIDCIGNLNKQDKIL